MELILELAKLTGAASGIVGVFWAIHKAVRRFEARFEGFDKRVEAVEKAIAKHDELAARNELLHLIHIDIDKGQRVDTILDLFSQYTKNGWNCYVDYEIKQYLSSVETIKKQNNHEKGANRGRRSKR